MSKHTNGAAIIPSASLMDRVMDEVVTRVTASIESALLARLTGSGNVAAPADADEADEADTPNPAPTTRRAPVRRQGVSRTRYVPVRRGKAGTKLITDLPDSEARCLSAITKSGAGLTRAELRTATGLGVHQIDGAIWRLERKRGLIRAESLS